MNKSSKEDKTNLSNAEILEVSDYLSIDQEQLYFVLHPTVQPARARVLLAGPFASERPHRYIPWVRWARYLASRGFEVMRFDYRGAGESTGVFENFGFQEWLEDLHYCADWLNDRSPSLPLVIHGLGMGALLGDRLFSQGVGDAYLAWLPPKSAREMLYEQLKLKMSNNYTLSASERKTREQLVNELECGLVIEVEGYNWTPKLWAEAVSFVFGENANGDYALRKSRSAWYEDKLDALAAHALGGVGPNPLRATGGINPMRLVNPDLSTSFNSSINWMINVLTEQGVS